jgi:polyisoprenoid-binding protein YceI
MFKQILATAVVVTLVIAGAAAYSLFRTPQTATGPLEAIPVTLAQATATGVAAEELTEASAMDNGINSTGAEIEAAQIMTATTQGDTTESVTESAVAASETTAQSATPIIFEISQEESQARFVIDEVLRSQPTTVVGVTDQVAGQLAIDPSNPAAVQIGAIQVNVRTLATDNDMRNRAIKNAILQTDAYELVTFVPSEVSGLPTGVEIGASYSVQIVGDLTIKNVTRQATFDATVTVVSESRLEGAAATTILYRDFDLFIPDSPSVDTVADEVRLELDFVAEAVA